MNLSKISVRYAKAIFMLAKEQNLLSQVYEDFNFIKDTLSPIEDFKNTINSPIIRSSEKKNLFAKVFAEKINDITLNFLNFVVDKNREIFLPEIIINFKTLYRKEYNIKEIVVTTISPMSAESAAKINKIIGCYYNCNTEIRNIISDKIIGGIIIRVDNNQLDLSVTTQLREIKHTLKSEAYKIGL